MLLRLLLSFEQNIYRKFYWFEMKGMDFYWGSAYKASPVMYTEKGSQKDSVIINIPENIDDIIKTSGKYSYHESGSFHYKANPGGNIYEQYPHWPKKENILKPVRFYAVISRAIIHYENLIANPNKDKANALIVELDKAFSTKRCYFEFFLSPTIYFELQGNLLGFDKPIPNFVTYKLSENMFLIIRYIILSNLGEWNPNREIGIIPDDLD